MEDFVWEADYVSHDDHDDRIGFEFEMDFGYDNDDFTSGSDLEYDL